MKQIFLIDKSTFCDFEDLSMNINEDRVLVFVKKAQDLDIKPFLGHALYYEMLSHMNENGKMKNNSPQQYVDLLEGCEYKDRHGHIIYFEGLRPTVVYFTFARFIESDGIHYTATGPVTKMGDNSTPITVGEKVKLVQQQRSVANAHANEVEKFFRDNRSLFPLWQFNDKNKSARQSGPRIRGIDRTQFNNPNAGMYGNNFGYNDLNY